VSNLIRWTGIGVGRALKPVTANPARLLGLSGQKGSLHPGADADLLVLSWGTVDGNVRELQVDQVWKFGTKVYDRDDDA
jgi:N-acetylglucosamine-6-phosphate deacetylase